MSKTFREDEDPVDPVNAGRVTSGFAGEGATWVHGGPVGVTAPLLHGLLPCLSDRFTPVRDLASGGESDVLLVADGAGVEWVVKQYRQAGWSPSVDVLEVLADRKIGESRESWAADVRTQHVVWLEEWGVDSATGLFFEVQEFISGGALAGQGGLRGSRLGDWPAEVFAGALIDAVSAFHQVVGAHRDVKPANVLVRWSDLPVLVLADVGLARDVGEFSNRFSGRDGSPAYQAPEASQGKVSQGGDWWSVGMMIAQACLGRHPLALADGSLPQERVLQSAISERDIPLDGIADLRLRLLCQGLLTRDPELRWGARQISAWRAGDSPATGYGGVVPVRSVWFDGFEFLSVADLAAAFAAQPALAGKLLFEQRDPVLLDDLAVMLRAGGLNEAESLLRGHRSGAWQSTFLRLVAEMDPGLPPVLAGQQMTPHRVADAAREVVAGTGEGLPWQTAWIRDHDVWRLWRRLPGMSAAPGADGALRDLRVSGFDDQVLCVDEDGSRWVPVEERAGCHVLVDRRAYEAFWSSVSPVVEAWCFLWAVRRTETTAALKGALDGLNRAAVVGQRWWTELDETARLEGHGEWEGIRCAVLALTHYPIAVTAEVEATQWLDRERQAKQTRWQQKQARLEWERLRSQDVEQVRVLLMSWLTRQGVAYWEWRSSVLRNSLVEVKGVRRLTRGSGPVEHVWEEYVRLRAALKSWYGLGFGHETGDEAFVGSGDQRGLLMRELAGKPTIEAWPNSGVGDDIWIPPAPVLVLARLRDRAHSVLVDPLAGVALAEIPGTPSDPGSAAFQRTANGRLVVDGRAVPDLGQVDDPVVKTSAVERWVERGGGLRISGKSVGVSVGMFKTSQILKSKRGVALVFPLADGRFACVTVSTDGRIHVWDAMSGQELPSRLPDIGDVVAVHAHPRGGGW